MASSLKTQRFWRRSTQRTAIFDKTGTLTYGEPKLIELLPVAGYTEEYLLQIVASIERYSKHPLSGAILEAAEARRLVLHEATEVGERPGEGLQGAVGGRRVQITSRNRLLMQLPDLSQVLQPVSGGLECAVLIDERYAGMLLFRDEPRAGGAFRATFGTQTPLRSRDAGFG